MPTWPGSLPQNALVRGYGEQLEKNSVATITDTGPGKSRPKFSDVGLGFTIGMVLTEAQKDTLDTFFHITLQDGENSFTHVDPIARTSMDFEFIKEPNYKSLGSEFQVTLNLIESI